MTGIKEIIENNFFIEPVVIYGCTCERIPVEDVPCLECTKNLDKEEIGYHVANWLSKLLYSNDIEDIPQEDKNFLINVVTASFPYHRIGDF